MTVVNTSDKPVTLKRNCKLADVFPCVAVKDLDVFQGVQFASQEPPSRTGMKNTGADEQPAGNLPSASLHDPLDKSLLELGLSGSGDGRERYHKKVLK